MTRNTIIYSIVLALYAIAIMTLVILINTVFLRSTIILFILVCMIGFFIAFWLLMIFMSGRLIRKDNIEFNENFKKKQYKKIIEDQEQKLKSYFEYSMVMNTKFNLLVAYFYKGENEKAINYLKKNKWYNFKDEVLVFEGLVALYEDNYDLANEKYNLIVSKRRSHDVELLGDVIDSYKKKKNTPKTAKIMLPIVKEIVKKY